MRKFTFLIWKEQEGFRESSFDELEILIIF